VSDIKPEISSVYMYQDGNDEIVFVSTDSFRLAEKKIKVKGIPEFPGIIIPYKNIIEIIRVLGDTDSEVSITLSKNQISLSTGMTYITSRIIDGVFPDYKQIVPKESTTTVVALKQDLVSALKLSNIFSDKFNQITCVVKPGEKLFEVYAKNTDVGENTASIAASLTGQPIEINCNYRYVMDCFQSIGADSVSFDFAGANRPLMIRGISDTSFLYLVMPMNR
jgi:DNA polymerase-3 subunit beta